MERNFKANASSKNPRTTLTLFSHPPDFGIDFSRDGNKANNANGMASATENPNMPIAGPKRSPLEAASTSNVPIIGPVQENETTARLKAMKNNPIRPPLSDLESILLTNELGSVISNAPKKEAAKTTSKIKKKKLKIRLLIRHSVHQNQK